jgi:hypothetical protein
MKYIFLNSILSFYTNNNNGAISCPLNAEMPPPPSPSMTENNANTNANSQPALTGSLSKNMLLFFFFFT